jgi:hypothetical protein
MSELAMRLSLLAQFVARSLFRRSRLIATSTPIYWRNGVVAHNASEPTCGPPRIIALAWHRDREQTEPRRQTERGRGTHVAVGTSQSAAR